VPIISELDRARVVIEYLNGASIDEIRAKYATSRRIVEKVLALYGLDYGTRRLLKSRRMKRVLEALEKAGGELTFRELSEKTGIPTKYLSMPVSLYSRLGLIERDGDVIRLTEKGREMLEKIREAERRAEEARRRAEAILRSLTRYPQ